jgi:ATP-dependent exoDNAse (exonuclease V) beta subunit
MISSSLTVRRLVSLLSSIDNPDDSMARYLAEHLEVEIPESYSSIIDLCEDLLRKLRDHNENVFNSEVLYVQSFMDVLREYVERNGNSLHAFLKDWEGNTQSISSPKNGDSVRIMTVHKSKGLDFPYVIVPFMEGISLSRQEKKWCRPDVKGTALEGVAEGVYDVTLSGKSEKTLFASHYKDETLLQYVDNMNVVYVALTRAKECMEIISALPEEGDKDFSQLLYWYACKHGEKLGFRREDDSFFYGEIPQKSDKKNDDDADSLTADFSSWPIGDRLRFKADSADFFNEDGETGMAASHRIKGIVLHDILAHVNVKSDIEPAVEDAVLAGVISADEAGAVKELLYDRICSVESEGWFSEENVSVLNEMEIISSKGKIYRPDRVVKVGNSVKIIDYKFGEHNNDYEKKLKEYADVWEEMGYCVDSACLWYVATGEILRVL